MKNVLYIGNYLQNNKTNSSYMFQLGSKLEQAGYNIVYSSNKNNKIARLLDMLFSFLKNRAADVVLIDTYSTTNFYYAFILSQLCRFFNKDYITILHGGNLSMRLKKHPLKSKMLFNNALANVSPSLYLESEFKKFNYNNVEFIPNSIEIENYKFKTRNFESIKLLWVRSFSKIYNPKMAVDVLKLLIDSGNDASLCMVGPDTDGTLTQVKIYAKELNVEIEFTGKLSKHDWIKKSENFNIFINTTNFDNMPVSVIEAMALGLPVVSTNVGGMPYLIKDEHDGILITTSNPKNMANAILEITNNEEKANQLSFNARNKVEQFDWNIVKQQWMSLLQRN